MMEMLGVSTPKSCAIYFDGILVPFILRCFITNESIGDCAEIHTHLYVHDERAQPYNGHKNTAISASLTIWAIKGQFLQACLS